MNDKGMKRLGGNKPVTNASRLAFADMKEHIALERKRVDRKKPEIEFTTMETYVPGYSFVATPRSKYLNTLLGLNTTEGILSWYKKDVNAVPVKKVGYVAGLRAEIERLRNENRALQLQLAK